MSTGDRNQPPRRSAGTARAFRLAGKLTTEAALAADIEALNENVTLRLVCVFRADYGHYPRRFNPRVISGPSSSPSSVPIFR